MFTPRVNSPLNRPTTLALGKLAEDRKWTAGLVIDFDLDSCAYRGDEFLAVCMQMINIAYVVGGLILLMLAGSVNENGGSLVGAVPLALLGVSAILKGLTHRSDKATHQPSEEPTARFSHQVEDVPLAEEIADAPPAPTAGGQKIRAKIVKPAPAEPTPFRNPHSSGTVSLNSAKYMNGGKTGFRKGGVNETHD
jgi:hypothetical protein